MSPKKPKPPKAHPLTPQERADIAWNYASALQLIGAPMDSGGYVAPSDIKIMLEHRLRAALRDGECPDCPTCSLEAALEGLDAQPEEAKTPSVVLGMNQPSSPESP